MKDTDNTRRQQLNPRIPTLFIAFILAQPVIDVITSLNTRFFDSGITFGVAVRALFMVLMALYIWFVSDFRYKKSASFYLAVVVIYCLAYLVYAYLSKGSGLLFTDLKGLIKTFYFPIVLIGSHALVQDYSLVISDRILACTGGIYSAVILVAALTGTSFESYVWFSGYTGWFYAANEIGAILAMLVPVAAMVFFTGKEKLRSGATVLLGLYACTYMGTKVPFFVIAIYLGLALGWFLIHSALRRTPQVLKGLGLNLAGLLVLVVLFNGSPLQQNMAEKFSGPLIPTETPGGPVLTIPWQPGGSITVPQSSTGGEFTMPVGNEPGEGVPVKPDAPVLTSKTLWNRLLSNRLQFITPVAEFFERAPAAGKVLGIGYANRIEAEAVYSKAIEMDFLDIAYSHGYLGFVLFMLPLVLTLAWLARQGVRHAKRLVASLEFLTYLYVFLMSLAVAFATGHTLVAPAVSFFVALLAVKLMQMTDTGAQAATPAQTPPPAAVPSRPDGPGDQQ